MTEQEEHGPGREKARDFIESARDAYLASIREMTTADGAIGDHFTRAVARATQYLGAAQMFATLAVAAATLESIEPSNG